MASISRREWLDRILEHLIYTSKTIARLISEWHSLPDDRKEARAGIILAEIGAVVAMMKSRQIFRESDD